ncbi:TKL protein kinase, partial [Phytophthora palmivora]
MPESDSGTHRFWSIYEDTSFASGGSNCTAKFDESNILVGYVNESCHDGRVAGLDELFDGESYMAYDYYNNNDCTDYENSAAYLASGDCEALYDGYSSFRSATISVSNGTLVWKRNMGNTSSGHNCLGSTGLGYYEFDVPIEDISEATCYNVADMVGGFIFYNTSVTPSSSTGSGISGGAIAGIAVGIITVIVGIIALVCAWTGGVTADSEPSTLGAGLWNDSVIIATRVPRDQVVVGSLISRGGFGEVYRGKYNKEDVAVKMLFPEMRSDLKKVNDLLGEVKLMAELMKGGDLRSLLKEFEAKNYPQGIDYDKIRIVYEIAQALTYLHSLSPIVIHRDLKSKNILLTEDLEAKVTDFGASRERQEQTMTAGVGTMLWMAPEVMMAEHYDEKADIFSFGVLLSELDLQSLPYSHA